MKTIRCYCPYCGAPTTIESDNLYREYMFCAHCGSKILLTEDITSRIVDVGKIKQEENKKYIFDKKQEIRQQEKNKYDNLADEQRHRYHKLALFSFITFFLSYFLENIFKVLNLLDSDSLFFMFFYVRMISLFLGFIGIILTFQSVNNKMDNHK